MRFNKKGQSVLDNFGSLAIGVGALCITLVVAFLIMAQAKNTMTNDNTACNAGSTWNGSVCCIDGMGTCEGVNQTARNSLAWNTTGTLQNATSGVAPWVSIIIITAIGAALIGMVAMFRR